MSESKNVQSELIPKIATGFCGGISGTMNLCGAVSGGIMAISLFYGRSAPDQSAKPAYQKVNVLLDLFEKQFGSTNCYTLIGCDLGTEEGQRIFKSKNLRERCTTFTEAATRMVMSILEEG